MVITEESKTSCRVTIKIGIFWLKKPVSFIANTIQSRVGTSTKAAFTAWFILRFFYIFFFLINFFFSERIDEAKLQLSVLLGKLPTLSSEEQKLDSGKSSQSLNVPTPSKSASLSDDISQLRSQIQFLEKKIDFLQKTIASQHTNLVLQYVPFLLTWILLVFLLLR